MSVVVVISDGQRCCMASDSQASNGNAKLTMASKKVFALPRNRLIGYVGSHVIGTYLEQRWCVTDLAEREGPPESLKTYASRFSDDLRAWLKEREQLEKDSEGRVMVPASMLIAEGGKFVVLDGAGAVVELESPWWAIGSGADGARGALWALTAGGVVLDMVEQIARLAVEASCHLDDGCGPPVQVAWTYILDSDGRVDGLVNQSGGIAAGTVVPFASERLT